MLLYARSAADDCLFRLPLHGGPPVLRLLQLTRFTVVPILRSGRVQQNASYDLDLDLHR